MTGEKSTRFLNIVPSVTVFGREVRCGGGWGVGLSSLDPVKETPNAAACWGHLDRLMLSALSQTFDALFQFQYNYTSAKSNVRKDLDDGNWWKRTSCPCIESWPLPSERPLGWIGTEMWATPHQTSIANNLSNITNHWPGMRQPFPCFHTASVLRWSTFETAKKNVSGSGDHWHANVVDFSVRKNSRDQLHILFTFIYAIKAFRSFFVLLAWSYRALCFYIQKVNRVKRL